MPIEIRRKDLKTLVSQGRVQLVEVLPAADFKKEHLPEAIKHATHSSPQTPARQTLVSLEHEASGERLRFGSRLRRAHTHYCASHRYQDVLRCSVRRQDPPKTTNGLRISN